MPDVVNFDALTDTVTERAFTPTEYEQHERDLAEGAALAQSETAAAQAAATAKASARIKLAALGLTDDEIAALVGA